MLVLARAHHPPIGQHDLGREQRVDRQPVAAHEPADPAAEREAADARVRDLARGHREPVLLGGRVDLAEQRAAADAHDRALGVDLDGVQPADVDA